MTATARRTDSDFHDVREQYPALVTYPQAAEITSVSVRTLKRETAAGRLPCYRVGRSRTLRLRLDDVLGLLTRVA